MAASDPPIRAVVCDAGPLIHLDEIERLHLLDEFEDLLVPPIVKAEFLRHRPLASAVAGRLLHESRPASSADAATEALARMLSLDAGEREALVLARERRADLFLTHDAAARLAAQTLGVPVHGTIGILFRAVRKKRMTGAELAAILASLPSRSTLHIKPSLLKEFIDRATAESQ